jgi:hypothetical protein
MASEERDRSTSRVGDGVEIVDDHEARARAPGGVDHSVAGRGAEPDARQPRPHDADHVESELGVGCLGGRLGADSARPDRH